VALDNNAAERAVKLVVIGRKNWMFAGSDAGGEILADAMTIIETAKISGLNTEAYLADVLARFADHINPRLDKPCPGTGPQKKIRRSRRRRSAGYCRRAVGLRSLWSLSGWFRLPP